MTVIAHGDLEPVDQVLSPAGVKHLTSTHPDSYETLCGMITKRRGWTTDDREALASAATCLVCVLTRRQSARNLSLGNYDANEGVDECGNCGGVLWESDTCTKCGAAWVPPED